MTNTGTTTTTTRNGFAISWTRIEGILGVGALLTSFIWFLGMPAGMAIAVGFGSILVLDFIRSLIFDSSRPDLSEHSTLGVARQ